MIIAEIAQAHDGSVGILHSYIDALAATGVDALNFKHILQRLKAVSLKHSEFLLAMLIKPAIDYWKRMELSLDQWIEIKDHCHKCNLQFISSPFSCKAVDLLEQAGVDSYKIGSGEVTNLFYLKKLLLTKKPVIISSGMSTLDELDIAISLFKRKKY